MLETLKKPIATATARASKIRYYPQSFEVDGCDK